MRTTRAFATILGAAMLAFAPACRMAEEPAKASDESKPVAAETKSLSPSALPKQESDTTSEAAAAAPSEGRIAPEFALADLNGAEHSLAQLLEQEKIVVLEWFNPDCPFTRAYHQPERRMAETFASLGDDVVWLAINSGAEGQQGAGLERNQQAARDFQIAYPVLLDPSGRVGNQYGAATTPHMYVITPNGRIIYEGAIDDSAGRGEATKNYVVAAIEDYRAGRAVKDGKTRPFGCSVKYAR